MESNAPNRCEWSETIEKQISRVPSGCYLAAAFLSMAVSGTLKCVGRKHAALFIGQWAAPLLVLGLYSRSNREKGGK